jgi:hypothetical protein
MSEVFPSSSDEKNRYWAQKHKKLTRYDHEHNKDPDWYKHEKHVLICTWSGRPVYSRYGDESKMAAYMGVITAIISNFQRMGDQLRSVVAGKHIFLFTLIGPFYLVAISRTGEPLPVLEQQLHYAHAQIITVLTGSIVKVLEDKPGYDIRNLIGGTEDLLTELIDECGRSPSFLMNSYQCLRMSRSTRSRVSTALRRGTSKSLLFAVLMAGSEVVSVIEGKDRTLHQSDLLLLSNTITNSQSLRSSESWTPICLPKFSDKGYLYAYVCFLSTDISLTLITGSDSAFHEMQVAKGQMLEALNKKNGLVDIRQAMEHLARAVHVDEVDCGTRELRHFIYKSEALHQVVVAADAAPYAGKRARKQLFRRYQHAYHRLRGSKGVPGNTVYYQVAEDVVLVGWSKPGDFTLLAAFSPLATKDVVLLACNKLLKWLKREYSSLFLVDR